MSLESDFVTVTAKLNADATAITPLVGADVGTPSGTQNYSLPSGYTITINADGISSVLNQGGQIASGRVAAIDGSWFYQAFQNRSFTPNITKKLVLNNPNGAIVTHYYSGCVNGKAVYTYTITGNKIDVSVLFFNTGTTDIQYLAFQTPQFLFDNWSTVQATSNQLNYDQSHTQNNASVNNLILSYPSSNVPFAATYIRTTAGGGKVVNFCTWSSGNPFDWFMTMGVGIYPAAGITLTNFFFKPIAAGGSNMFKFSYFFIDSTDPFVLLQGYKDFLRSKLPIQYNPDARPWGRFSSINTSYIRPDNPYGYNDGGNGIWRRFDKLAGCQDFVAKLVPPMVDTGYQGIMMWQPQGINPRGVQYRPDFNVWPSVSVPNIPTLFGGFTSAGLRFGLQARPGVTVTSATWDTDSLTGLNDLKYSWDDLSGRLKWATNNGVTAFYLDSFVGWQTDHAVLQKMRTQLGPNVQLFSEFNTALSVPLAGQYLEFSYANGNYVFPKNYAALKFIYPEANCFANFISALPPGGYSVLYPYMFQNKLSPMVEDYRTQSIAPGSENAIIKPLITQYIDLNHHWK